MKFKSLAFVAMAAAIGGVGATATAQTGRTIAGATCNAPPRINCAEANCIPALTGADGNALEPETGRKFFLDFPCDMRPGEDVTLILSLHGAGSIGNWQRHYAPFVDLKEKHRLVIATPTAATAEPSRRWAGEADDEYLHNIVDMMIRELGRQNIESFWLAGHSQGGITSRRLVCTPYFADKVDGWLSLSGGRIGSTPFTFGGRGDATAPTSDNRPEEVLPECDFSFIFTAGELEIAGLPDYSPWGEKYGCADRVRRQDIVDERAGYVTATDQSRGPSWGRFARPGTAEAWDYAGCDDGRVVADFVRLDKGHTEGLEPHVIDAIVTTMVSARGGKIRRGG